MEQLILVRHGETVHNAAGIAQGWQDSELSPRGRSQVEKLARRLVAWGVDAIYSSPLSRALATAEAIREVIDLPIVIVEDLKEMNYGKWEGKNFPEVRKTDEAIFRRWIAEDDFPCPDGESHQDVLVRMKRAFDAVSSAARPVLVTHGTAIRVGATALLNVPLLTVRHLAQDNAAINVFLCRNERYILKLWNDTSHCQG
jgi:broad specificity phosphatase PhoE